ncbi:MAG: hypothetical protein M3Z84_07890 [Actinomycetota bacterium]|nr:hypothetical protein [Actinomycetota bacterium]
MSKGQKATRYEKLEDAGDEALRVIHQHLLVAASQLHALVLPQPQIIRQAASRILAGESVRSVISHEGESPLPEAAFAELATPVA